MLSRDDLLCRLYFFFIDVMSLCKFVYYCFFYSCGFFFLVFFHFFCGVVRSVWDYFFIFFFFFFIFGIYLIVRWARYGRSGTMAYISFAAFIFAFVYSEWLGVLFAFSVCIYALAFRKNSGRFGLPVASATGTIAALALTIWQYS